MYKLSFLNDLKLRACACSTNRVRTLTSCKLCFDNVHSDNPKLVLLIQAASEYCYNRGLNQSQVSALVVPFFGDQMIWGTVQYTLAALTHCLSSILLHSLFVYSSALLCWDHNANNRAFCIDSSSSHLGISSSLACHSRCTPLYTLWLHLMGQVAETAACSSFKDLQVLNCDCHVQPIN